MADEGDDNCFHGVNPEISPAPSKPSPLSGTNDANETNKPQLVGRVNSHE